MALRKVKFGEVVMINQRFIRTIMNHKYHGPHSRWLKWVAVPISEQSAIVIGKRTLSNGKREYDSESGYSYSPLESIVALLVVTDMKHKPFLVPYFEISE